jgi:hypothetical protein
MRLRIGPVFALSIVALEMLVTACGDDESESSGSSTPPTIDVQLFPRTCVSDGDTLGIVTVKKTVEHVSYDCQLGMCDRGGCTEEKAYQTYRTNETSDAKFRVTRMTCRPDCEITAMDSTTGRTLTIRGVAHGDVIVELDVVVEEPNVSQPTTHMTRVVEFREPGGCTSSDAGASDAGADSPDE